MLPQVFSGRAISGDSPDFIYDLYRHLPPGIVIDIGAGAGAMTKKVLENSPNSSVIAFEPYPGNLPYLRDALQSDERVDIRAKAVADAEGSTSFVVPSVVSGDEPGWEDRKGYSSVGFIRLSSDHDDLDQVQVEVTRLDSEVNERIRFMKVDVQGGEAAVLRGAESLLNGSKVDLIYMEFSGDIEVLEILDKNDFVIFDSLYLMIPRSKKAAYKILFKLPTIIGKKLMRWRTVEKVWLSTGVQAEWGWPGLVDLSFSEYCKLFKRAKYTVGAMQNDVICVHKSFLPEFFMGVSKLYSHQLGKSG